MARATHHASLVGMKHYGFSGRTGEAICSAAVTLKREPSNPHDSNAIAVHVSGVKAGHIDRQSASIIAAILDQGGTCQIDPFAWSRERGSIPIAIRIEREVAAIAPPKLPADGAGIYLISIQDFPEVYIGQARIIKDRIKHHWRELSLGVHSNPLMRRLWHEKGGRSFSAAIVEMAPNAISSAELSLWLEGREHYWIEHYDERVGVINFDKPNVVLVGEERIVARNRRLAEREVERANRQARVALSTKAACLCDSLYALQEEIDAAERNIKADRRHLGLLFRD
jgi:hypothetical protein